MRSKMAPRRFKNWGWGSVYEKRSDGKNVAHTLRIGMQILGTFFRTPKGTRRQLQRLLERNWERSWCYPTANEPLDHFLANRESGRNSVFPRQSPRKPSGGVPSLRFYAKRYSRIIEIVYMDTIRMLCSRFATTLFFCGFFFCPAILILALAVAFRRHPWLG